MSGRREARVREGEQGQVLLLFVVIFSVILAMGALALDQGFWLGRHRATQAAADASARAGALVYVANTTASGGCSAGTPRRVAAANAEENRIDVNVGTCSGPQSAFVASGDCPGVGANRPSVNADVGQELRSFFSGFFGIDEIETRAESTACVGTISAFGIDEDRNEHITSGLPVYIRSDDTYNGRGCFSGGAPKIGQQCVIVRACERQGGSPASQADNCTFGGQPVRSGFFEETDDDECEGDGNMGGALDAIEDRDMSLLCRVESGSGCPGSNVCIDAEPAPEDEGDHADIMNAFEDRLESAPNSCNEFHELFKRVDGGNVARPWVSGGNPQQTVYFRDPDCDMDDAGRVGVLVFTDSSATQRVKGFAVVYITGCFTRGSSFTTSENTCSSNSNDDHDSELRGVLLRTFMPEADRGDLGRVSIVTSGSNANINIPYSIQTVE
jgi:hypothetical protein